MVVVQAHGVGMGRLWSIQCLPTQSCHGMVETSHGLDFSFLSAGTWVMSCLSPQQALW